MRKLLLMVSAVFVGACGAPAYQPPTVRVAPAYVAASRDGAPVAKDTATSPARGTGVMTVASGTPVTSRVDAQSAQFTTSVSSAPFWSQFDDSTLTSLIEEALRTSVDVDAAEARVTGARAARRMSSFDMGPTITAIGSAVRQRSSIAQLPGLTSQLPQQNLYDVGFDASWELDVFGRVNRTVNAYSTLAASAEQSLKDVQVTLASEVARSYFELRGAEQQLAVARRNADNQSKTLSLTEDRLKAGRGNAFDTERARSVLQLTLAAIPTIESQIAADRNRIATLVGRSPNTLPANWLGAGELPALPDTVKIGSPEQLVRRRPDVLGAERQLAAQSLFVSAARADYLPRISLSASAGYTATTFDSLSRRGTSRIIAGPVVTFPLLDLGRVKAKVDVAHAREDEAKAQYNATVLRAVEETETSLVAYDRAHARLGLLAEAVRSSTRAADLAQQRFDAGLTDFLQVLDAQRTLLDAENQLAQAHTVAATALVAVYKSVGGTWPMNSAGNR
jgi:NodT family efflux transporter outer membrane factor (OMF) lipoprotein